jgi:hypothetical protein
MITLYHHPYTRAANAIWMLEEVGVPYELAFVDIMKGAQKDAPIVAQNPMGNVPILKDGASSSRPTMTSMSRSARCSSLPSNRVSKTSSAATMSTASSFSPS